MERSNSGLILAVLLMVLRQGNSQCYKSFGCTGNDTVPGPTTLSECCFDAADGVSWSISGVCTNCIVHGLATSSYPTKESAPALIDTKFIKRESHTSAPALSRLPNSLEGDSVTAIERRSKETGHISGTRLETRDDDRMFIGFSKRTLFVREDMFGAALEQFPLNLPIHSIRMSASAYTIQVSVGEGTATVTLRPMGNWDATFGATLLPSNVIISTYGLHPGETEITDVQTVIRNDVEAESNETFTLRVSPSDSDTTELFECYEENEDPIKGNYFCTITITIVDDDKPFVVSFENTIYEVSETKRKVEVCVILTNPANTTTILPNEVGVEVFEDFLVKTNKHFPRDAVIANGDFPHRDYEKQEFGLNSIRNQLIDDDHRRICYNQTVVDDLRLEATEYAGLTLEVQDLISRGGPTTIYTEVDIGFAALRIIDNDMARVGLEMTSFYADETSGTIEICAVVYKPTIVCPIEFDFNITFETNDESAETPIDYVGITTYLMFNQCDKRKCINVTIEKDNIKEDTEFFSASLGWTANLNSRITLSPLSTIVEIREFIYFEEATYVVNEGQSIATCFFIEDSSPPIAGYESQFSITVKSSNESTQAGEDYVTVSTTLLGSTGQRLCVMIRTLDDVIVEDDETLILLAKADETLSVSYGSTTVVKIIDDEVVTLGFNGTLYQVTEGENVEICLTEIIAELEKDIVFTVKSSGVTATSGKDYTAVSRQFTFGPSTSTSFCVTVAAATDIIHEDSETLTLTITSTDQSLHLIPDTAIITIQDNTNLATITAIPIVVMVLLAVVIVIGIIIGIVYYKKRKQQSTSVRKEFEMSEHAAAEKPSGSTGISHTSKPSRRGISNYVDAGYSAPIPPIKVNKSMVYGVSGTNPAIYDEILESGEYEVMDSQVP